MNTIQLLQFSLRAFRYTGDEANAGFTVTLMCGDQVVANIAGHLGGEAEIEVEPTNEFYWDQFQRYAAEMRAGVATWLHHDEPAASLLLEMADTAYHARRLQVTSLRHTTFRLRGDKPGTFRYLRGRPYSVEIEGQLRLTYGRRLETVYRRGPGAEPLAA